MAEWQGKYVSAMLEAEPPKYRVWATAAVVSASFLGLWLTIWMALMTGFSTGAIELHDSDTRPAVQLKGVAQSAAR